MDWITRLNQRALRLELAGGAHIDLYYWGYSPEFEDNQPHRHTFFEVCLVGDHGKGAYRIDGSDHPIGPGDLFAARPGIVHQIVTSRPTELLWLAFQLPPLKQTDSLHAFRKFASSNVIIAPDSGGRVLSVWRALQAVGGESRDAAVDHLATALLHLIAEAFSPSPPAFPDRPDSLVKLKLFAGRRAVRFVHDNLDQPLKASEVARHVGVSERHLSRLFRAITGLPFYEYVIKVRLDRASYLLGQSDLPVKQIGAAVGYPDVHHFTRLFRERVGCPPAAFRSGSASSNVRIMQTSDPYL